ncbi:MAG: radical SAM protein, partial [Candidatus Omnitrophica bacterium]|nr:radical SAM protein [Candidatus Omnitrophota bacterium]
MLEKLRRVEERAEELNKILTSCTLCPRKCKVDRISGKKGVCGAGKDLMVSSYGPHFGEEQVLVGMHGSG